MFVNRSENPSPVRCLSTPVIRKYDPLAPARQGGYDGNINRLNAESTSLSRRCRKHYTRFLFIGWFESSALWELPWF